MDYINDIFVISSWTDTKEKEEKLVKLIEILKGFDIPIMIAGHYPVPPEIQRMVDYYLYDKDNDLLIKSEYNDYGVASGRWTRMNEWEIINDFPFHHDYAIWLTMKKAFNFANFLGKKTIHFLDYDNFPEPYQYRQGFLEYSKNHDAVIYEYQKNSSANSDFGEYCATFIFSIKTDIAIELFNKVNSKQEFFSNRPKGWQLERVFLQHLKEITNNIFVTKYIPNDNEFNTQAVWNRDGIDRNGGKFQIYLGCNVDQKLYAHFVSGFFDIPAENDYLVEIVYGNETKFHKILKDQYSLVELGNYRKGESVKIYYNGIEVFNEFLDDTFENFIEMNRVKFKTESKPKTININFVDGPFVEIIGEDEGDYLVEFIDGDTDKVEYSSYLKCNHWAKSSKKYVINWRIKITGNGLEFEHNFLPKNKRVLIGFESKSIGDTLAWMPYVEEFRKIHQCDVICSTFHNNLFKSQYPEIIFVQPGTKVDNLYGLYRLGYFLKDNRKTFNDDRHPFDPKLQSLQMVATHILGLDYQELLPKLEKYNVKKKKRVSIGIHSTSQAKYWNNLSGWQIVTDYLIKNGYEVLLLSRESNGYMGNYNPTGAIQLRPSSLESVSKKIQESELFIGVSSGLSWLAWANEVPTILISGFTDEILEPKKGIHRIINKDVCNGCWSKHEFDPSDWNWCPVFKNTERQFECSKEISSEMIINEINKILQI